MNKSLGVETILNTKEPMKAIYNVGQHAVDPDKSASELIAFDEQDSMSEQNKQVNCTIHIFQ